MNSGLKSSKNLKLLDNVVSSIWEFVVLNPTNCEDL